jgi:AAA+ ATPase superfamily predicted ATPase
MPGKFVDRERELLFLERKHAERGAQLVVIYGRRRIGKTEAALRFAADKPNVYFLATKSSEKENLDLFFESLSEHFGDEVLSLEKKWENAFKYLSKTDERLILIVDEFPHLIEANRAIPSIFQRGWDLYLTKTNLMLLLLGSSVGMMESEVLSRKSPLYGRRTGQWRMDGLEFRHVREFFPSYHPDDHLRVYAVAGGVPAYLLKFDPAKSFWSNVGERMLQKGEFLHNEVEFLLKEELREPKIYMSILRAIAAGAAKFSEVMNSTGLDKSKLSVYLQTLGSLGFVKKEVPVTESELRSKKGRYRLVDNFFAFWFRYVLPNLAKLEKGEVEPVAKSIRGDFDVYLGRVFEDVALEFVGEKLKPSKIGKWWHRGEEIDIVALDEDKREATFIEVKWADLRERECERILRQVGGKSGHVKWKRANERFGVIARNVQGKGDLRRAGYLAWDLEDIARIDAENS